MKIKKAVILSLILALLPASAAFAHKVILFAWVEEGYIHTQSSFGSKSKAKGCVITVVDEKGMVVHSGTTDQEGNHSFKVSEKINSDLILTLNAGTGHQAQWRIPRDELKTVASVKETQAAMKEKQRLEKGPSVFKIMGGIALIFLLALVAKGLKRRKKP